jgi:hypothetical protein
VKRDCRLRSSGMLRDVRTKASLIMILIDRVVLAARQIAPA